MSEFGQNFGRLLLRITVGGLLLFHGVSKMIHGVAWMAGPLAGFHLPFFIAYGAYIGEIVAPIFIILGIWTRPAALVVAFDLLTAIVLVSHARMGSLSPGGGWGMESRGVLSFYSDGDLLPWCRQVERHRTNGKWN